MSQEQREWDSGVINDLGESVCDVGGRERVSELQPRTQNAEYAHVMFEDGKCGMTGRAVRSR